MEVTLATSPCPDNDVTTDMQANDAFQFATTLADDRS